MSDSSNPSRRITKAEMVRRDLERELRGLVSLPQDGLRMSDRIEVVIPPEQRREIWQKLQLAGFDLPELRLSPRAFLIAATLVLTPVLLLVLSQRRWSLILSLLELAVIAHRWTRPLAIYPPLCCETIQQLVIHLTRFVIEDYKAGLWTHEEIAARVRQILAESAGVPVESVTSDTRLEKLFGC
jgi:hypothetical protein